MVRGYIITAKATIANAAKKSDRFFTRAISRKEALKEANKEFSSGAWSKGDYKITRVEETA